MSRFADPDALRTVDLGGCQCLGGPHESDWIKIRGEVSSNDVRRFVALQDASDEDVAAGLAYFIREWNLLGPKGEDIPVSTEALMLLKLDTASPLVLAIRDVIEGTVPNPPSAPSAASSRGSASRTPKSTPKPTT